MQAACLATSDCGGITVAAGSSRPQLRQSLDPSPSLSNETSWVVSNADACGLLDADPTWVRRGAAAYAGLARSDPAAVWSFQGWAIIDWDNPEQARFIHNILLLEFATSIKSLFQFF
jgi:hypothetical protein